MEINAQRVSRAPLNIMLPKQFALAAKVVTENGWRLLDIQQSIEHQADGIDGNAILDMLDSIEVSTRLMRTECHRAMGQKIRSQQSGEATPAPRRTTRTKG